MSDATYGTITVGRLVLRETFTVKADVHATTGIRTVAIEGEESMPPLSETALRQRNEDIMALRDAIVPIYWTHKSDFDGLYTVEDVSAELTDNITDVKKFAWSLRATRIGPTNSAEIESRLTGITRRNDFGKTGTLWHAPAIGAYAYYTGSTRPGTILNRPSEDGSVKVFFPIPANVSPRWSITPQNYRLGRARVKIDGLERSGTNLKDGATWELSNGIVKATPAASGGIALGVWNGTDYDTTTWNVSVGASATPVGDYQALSVLRNDFEMTTIRLVKNMNPSGRSTLDLSVRRGAKFVEGYLETDVATTLAVGLAVATNGTAPASGGYVVADTGNGGGRPIVGTARTFTAQTSRTGVQKNAAPSMDFFIGAEHGGQRLSIVDGSFETGASGWTATNCTFVQSSAAAYKGSFSGKLTTVGTPAQAYARPAMPGISGNKPYRTVMWAMSPAGWGTVSLVIDWWMGGGYDSTVTLTKSLPAGLWVPFVFDATSPAGRDQAAYGPTVGGNPPDGTVLYVDEVWLYDGPGTGDTAADLANQYIGSLAEMTMAVLR